jgi:hypothetical protein
MKIMMESNGLLIIPETDFEKTCLNNYDLCKGIQSILITDFESSDITGLKLILHSKNVEDSETPEDSETHEDNVTDEDSETDEERIRRGLKPRVTCFKCMIPTCKGQAGCHLDWYLD